MRSSPQLAISVATLPSPPLAGTANGNSRAWFEIVLDEPCLPVLLRVLFPQVAENIATATYIGSTPNPTPLAGYASTMGKSVQGPGRRVLAGRGI